MINDAGSAAHTAMFPISPMSARLERGARIPGIAKAIPISGSISQTRPATSLGGCPGAV